MDVSNSMNASSTSDPQGMSRLQRSKMIMEKLIDRLRNDKVALVVFAGKSYMQMPMTIDGQSAKMFLSGIKTSMVPMQGTAIGSAIDLSMTAFSKESKASKAIILITDAENFEDDAVDAAKRASHNDVQVDVIGIGTNEGAPIPTGNGDYMVDDSGQTIVTRLDEEKAQQEVMRESTTFFRDGMRKLFHNPLAVGSMIVLFVILVTIIIAPLIVPYSYSGMITVDGKRDKSAKNLPPFTYSKLEQQAIDNGEKIFPHIFAI